MTIDQLSVFVENKAGGLVEVTDLMTANGIDMRALAVAETPDFGVLRAIVSEPQKTARILTEAGFICKVTPVLAVAIDDRPGGLNAVLHVLEKGGINLEYTYAFVTRSSDTAYMVLRVNDNDKAAQVLLEHGMTPVNADAVFKI